MTLRSVLSAVDFSERSRDALRWAGAFAARFRARLTVQSAVDPLLAEAARMKLGQDLAKTDTEPALREFVASTWLDGAAPAVQTTLETPVGDPATAIVETAVSEAADLIVMGTQGLGGIRKWMLGSTTERVLRRTPVPVLVVPAKASGDPGVRPTLDVTRILAATDFSDSSKAAVQYAAELARQLSATLILAHVVEPLTVPQQWRSLVEEPDEIRVANARDRLNALAAQDCGSQPCEVIVSVGRAADVIDAIAQDCQAQLIVMGLNSDRGPFSPRPGSIAHRVLASTTVPVLVVPGM